jgi:hypothetical protein
MEVEVVCTGVAVVCEDRKDHDKPQDLISMRLKSDGCGGCPLPYEGGID